MSWTGTGARARAPNDKAGSGAAVAGVNLHSAGNGLEGAVPEVVEGLLVQVALLLPQALLEHLAFVSKLDHSLGVGVEGGDRSSHAAGEGPPCHAGGRQTEKSEGQEVSHTMRNAL